MVTHSDGSLIGRAARGAALALAWLVALGCGAWGIGALCFDLPAMGTWAAGIFGIVLLAAVIFVRSAWRKLGCVMFGFALVLAWWWTLQPSNSRPWQADVAQTGYAEINGDNVTLHNVRNCDYRSETDYTARWETRTVRLSQLTAIDLAITYWGLAVHRASRGQLSICRCATSLFFDRSAQGNRRELFGDRRLLPAV